jgi:hypothetical protein
MAAKKTTPKAKKTPAKSVKSGAKAKTTAKKAAKPAAAKKAAKPKTPAATAAADTSALDGLGAFDQISVAALQAVVTSVGALLTQIQQAFPPLVSLSAELRKTSTGRFRDGEDEALAAILAFAVAYPEFFKVLGNKDFGNNPAVFETELLGDRLAKRDLVAGFLADLDALQVKLSDTILKIGAVVRTPLLLAYTIARPIAEKGTTEMQTALAPAVSFYGNIAAKALKTKAANKKPPPPAAKGS